jgi:hypothetical protein
MERAARPISDELDLGKCALYGGSTCPGTIRQVRDGKGVALIGSLRKERCYDALARHSTVD